jgi:hypothetical protein
MGKFNQGILGGFSGKVGTVVGSSWKGIAYMRSVAQSVRNPRTPAQMEQRAKFKLLVNFLSDVTEFVRVGYGALAVKQTAQNAAFKYNYRNALSGEGESLKIDYSKVRVSQGNLPGAESGDVSHAGDKISLTWSANMGGNASSGDKVMMLVYNPAKRDALVMTDGDVSRMDGSHEWSYPDEWKGDRAEAYIAFRSAEGDVSNSFYLGSVEVPA